MKIITYKESERLDWNLFLYLICQQVIETYPTQIKYVYESIEIKKKKTVVITTLKKIQEIINSTSVNCLEVVPEIFFDNELSYNVNSLDVNNHITSQLTLKTIIQQIKFKKTYFESKTISTLVIYMDITQLNETTNLNYFLNEIDQLLNTTQDFNNFLIVVDDVILHLHVKYLLSILNLVKSRRIFVDIVCNKDITQTIGYLVYAKYVIAKKSCLTCCLSVLHTLFENDVKLLKIV
jgi:hypothetical protein